MVLLPEDAPRSSLASSPSAAGAAPPAGPPRSGRRSAGWVPATHPGAGTDPPGAGGWERDARLAELRERVSDGLPPFWRRARVGLPLPAAVVTLLLLTAVAGAAVTVLLLGRPGEAREVVPARAVVPVSGGQDDAGPSPGEAGQIAASAPPLAGHAPATPPLPLVVHVVGAVARAGVVEVPAGARVADAVEAAGGLTAEAELTRLNLARPLADGEQVHVPRPGEEMVVAAPPAPGVPGAAGGGTGATGQVLDLNAADQAGLETLPGIGPVLAERILQWRDAHGRFTAVDELGEVSGIGTALMERLRPLVTV